MTESGFAPDISRRFWQLSAASGILLHMIICLSLQLLKRLLSLFCSNLPTAQILFVRTFYIRYTDIFCILSIYCSFLTLFL